MKRRFGLLVLVVIAASLGRGSIAARVSGTKAAQAATELWLSLVDAHRYLESWDTAARLFRARVSRERWQAAAQTARAPLGQMSRVNSKVQPQQQSCRMRPLDNMSSSNSTPISNKNQRPLKL
jgi:hypothetical protein